MSERRGMRALVLAIGDGRSGSERPCARCSPKPKSNPSTGIDTPSIDEAVTFSVGVRRAIEEIILLGVADRASAACRGLLPMQSRMVRCGSAKDHSDP